MEDKVQITKETQKVVEQMKKDDIEEYGDMAYDEFQCDSCGEFKIRAGSLIYEGHNLCNDCVLLAELSFKFEKIKKIDELIETTKDKRFDSTYKMLFEEDDIQK